MLQIAKNRNAEMHEDLRENLILQARALGQRGFSGFDLKTDHATIIKLLDLLTSLEEQQAMPVDYLLALCQDKTRAYRLGEGPILSYTEPAWDEPVEVRRPPVAGAQAVDELRTNLLVFVELLFDEVPHRGRVGSNQRGGYGCGPITGAGGAFVPIPGFDDEFVEVRIRSACGPVDEVLSSSPVPTDGVVDVVGDVRIFDPR